MTLLTLVEQQLLKPGGFASTDLDRVFGQLMGPSIDAADLYFQHSRSESWMLEDGIVKDGTHSIEQGVGVRALSGEKTGFAYSDDIVLPALIESAHAARAIARSGAEAGAQALSRRQARALYAPVDPVASLDSATKVDWLRRIDAYARGLDPRLTQVVVSLSAAMDTVLVAASDGVLAADVRP